MYENNFTNELIFKINIKILMNVIIIIILYIRVFGFPTKFH
jgi:hypothetical protein